MPQASADNLSITESVMTSRADPRRFLPLMHLAYHVLLSLAEAPTHGYALVQRIRSRTGGLVDPGTGSFYSIVRKLNDDGLIAEADSRDGDRRRRRYAVTPLGRSVLLAEADRLATQVASTRQLRSATSTSRGGAR
jgi:DNA-binding PadR family transcriptional regulator